MNLTALSRKLFPRSKTPPRKACSGPVIEALEARIAPATLVSPTTLTFQDKSGDNVTVTISKPLFTAATINKVFTFDTGSVNGSNTAGQQLELLNITKLGQAAKGMDISITATPVNSSPGIVNVGYINASGIDLGNVTVGGDLGRIAAGNVAVSAIKSLTVDSMGAQGISTQMAGGNLNTKIAGGVGAITVNGDIDSASIGIGGGAKGLLGSLTITGSLNGGAGVYGGSVRTQGGIASVLIDGSINGSGGMDSGLIGTAGKLGTVVVDGDVIGGFGEFSGAILSTKEMQSVTIGGNLTGGVGLNSGEVGTAAMLDSVTVDGSVTGGNGPLSGVILAGGNIGAATIDAGLTGGIGAGSGQVGAGASINTITIGGSMTEGALIHAHQNIQSVTIYQFYAEPGVLAGNSNAVIRDDAFAAGPGITNSSIIADTGNIGAISVTGSGGLGAIAYSTITAAGSIGSITADAVSSGGYGILQTQVTAGKSLGEIMATSPDSIAICASQFQAGTGIGTVEAVSASGLGGGDVDAILNSTFQTAAGNIAGITAISSNIVDSGVGAIVNSGFDAGGNIGPVNSTGSILGSVFVAGINLGSSFNTNGAGTFGAGALFGFGSSKSSAGAQIGAITLTSSGNIPLIEQSTFLAGVHGAGADGVFGTKDDNVATGSSVGAITSPGGLNDVWIESGNIGATTSGEIVNTTYLATDAGTNSAGIGVFNITVTLPGVNDSVLQKTTFDEGGGVSSDVTHGIFNSTFISNAGIGPVNVTVNGIRVSGENGGISGSTFSAGHAIGAITVINNGSGSSGTNYGIVNTTFNAGLDGYGAVGDISVTLTDSGPDGNSAAMSGVQIDASVCACMSANMGSISVENADTASTAAGMVDCVFRTHGNIGPISATMDSGSPTAAAIVGTTFSAFGSIGDINVYGAVTGDTNGPSRFLAGYDIGSDMTFGNEDLSAKSLALQGGQSVGNVTVTGYFEGSDIAASINPGTNYIFGDSTTNTSTSNDSNIGTGGTIGLINIGTNVESEGSPFTFDHPTVHGIEAANFVSDDSPTVTAFGYTDDIPVVLYVDGGSNDVRITNLTQPVT